MRPVNECEMHRYYLGGEVKMSALSDFTLTSGTLTFTTATRGPPLLSPLAAIKQVNDPFEPHLLFRTPPYQSILSIIDSSTWPKP
jgi:hypothetical protein